MKPLQYRRLAALILVAAVVPACIADADPSMYEDEEEWVDETSEAVSTINFAHGRPVTVVGQAAHFATNQPAQN